MSARTRFATSLAALAALLFGVPMALVAVSRWRFASAVPWTSWPSWEALSSGVDGTSPLVEVILRVVLTAAWCCVVWLLGCVAVEVAFQIRHGMASTPRRASPMAPMVRSLAAGLVVLLPIVHAAPSLASGAAVASFAVAPVPPHATVAPTPGSVFVQAGDSVWSIAEAIAGRGDADHVAEQIVALNVGRTMNDGRAFSTAALIEPGWELRLPVSAEHAVVAGDSYWSIAEDHLLWPSPSSVLTATQQLMAANAPRLGYDDDRMLHPGDVVTLDALAEAQVAIERAPIPPTVAASVPVPSMSVVAPTPTTAPTTAVSTAVVGPSESGERQSGGRRLEGAMLLSVGLLGAVAARRRARLRSAEPGARLPLQLAADGLLETSLQTAQDPLLITRVDLVERVLGDVLVDDGNVITAIAVARSGEVRVWLARPATTVPSPFVIDDDGTVLLPAGVAVEVLAQQSNGGVFPAPALAHLGRCDHGELFLDVEAVGALAVDLESARVVAVLRHLVASLAVSPFASPVRLSICGLEDPLLAEVNVATMGVDEALTGWMRHRDVLDVALGRGTTDEARRRGPDAWEPDVLVAIDAVPLDEVAPRRGIALVGGAWVPSAWRLVADGATGALLQPLGIHVDLVELDEADTAAAADLLASAREPLQVVLDVVDLRPMPSDVVGFDDVDYTFLVRTLGQVDVIDRAGSSVRFEKAKSQELVVWLAHHRERSTRSAARSAMWSVDVRDATFANVVSDARRSLARAVAPRDDAEWIDRTLTDDLPLLGGVVADGDLLRHCVEASRGRDALDAAEVLRGGLELVTGLPFAGTGYLWPDAEGITSSLLLLATGAAAMMAEHCLALGDIEGVFWATGRGLQVLPGHEELIALRMRAHAGSGDLSGVRAEWDAYERALAADPWSDPEPAPKLLRLRAELLAPAMSA